MKKNLLFFALVLLILASCSGRKTDKETPAVDTIPSMIMQIQKYSRLYTAQMSVHKIVTHNDQKKLQGSLMKQDFSIDLPLGSRKIAIPMDATLKAYVDFTGFSAANVHRDGAKIEITLPDPKITLTATRINHDEVKQYVALTRSNFSDAELTEFERQGRESIIKDIPRLGIIELARESAARTLVPMLVQMGYREEDITVS
ncbi:MAG TPA: DUF4230 domain-containing protein, partial [Prevotella sp.]